MQCNALEPNVWTFSIVVELWTNVRGCGFKTWWGSQHLVPEVLTGMHTEAWWPRVV